MAQGTQCTVTHIPRKRRYDITLSSPVGPWEDRRGERLRERKEGEKEGRANRMTESKKRRDKRKEKGKKVFENVSKVILMSQQNMMNGLFCSYTIAALKLRVSITHTQKELLYMACVKNRDL